MTSKQIGEGSHVMSQAVMRCKPSVIPLFPITPQTHIVESLTEYVNDGKLDSKVIRADSEHSMVSALVGASATGARIFSATSSQGLALANEVLHIASGMRLPIVMGIANRALSAPINIWNDHSDAMNSRDASWIQLFCKNSQEIFDNTIQAYKIAEEVQLPVMVNLDGFVLSHLFEPIKMENGKEVREFIGEQKERDTLDPKDPKTFGPVGYPDSYMEFKHQQKNAMDEAKEVIKDVNKKYGKKFGREHGNGLVEAYEIEGKSEVVIAMGSIAGTIEGMIDEGEDIGLLRIRSFRPFPEEEIRKNLEEVEEVIVLDRSYSYGSGGPLYLEVSSNLPKKKVKSGIVGLGGKDVTPDTIRKVVNSDQKENWVDDLKDDLSKVEK